MKKHKLLAGLLSTAMLFGMVGCGGSTGDVSASDDAAMANTAADESEAPAAQADASQAGEQITLQLWSHFSDPNSTDGNYIAFYKALDALETEFPNIKVEHDGTQGDGYKTKLKTSMAANELPDIFFNWGAGTMQPYVESGLLLSFDDYLDAETKGRILEGTLDNFTFDGKIYGLPFSVACASLYVNTELFEEYDVTVPSTWEELLTAVDVFNANGITPITLGEKDLWPGLMIFGITAIRMAGYEDFNAALMGEGSYNTPQMVAAAQKLQELSQAGAFGENAMGTDQNDSVAAFKQGRAAMMFMGSWLNGDAEADDALVQGKVDAVKFPMIDGGVGGINEFHGGSGETFLVSADTEYPAEAIAVATFLCEFMSREQFLAGSGMPAWVGDMGDTSELNRLSLQVADLTSEATGYVYWLDSMTGGENADTLMNEIGKLIVGNVEPETFCENLQAMNEQ